MKQLLRYLLRQWYKISFSGSDRAMYVHKMYGKFKVEYPDGKIS